MYFSTSLSLFKRAKKYIPGGVNSPVRAFGAVGGHPIFIERAEGAYLYDEDGNPFVDLINGWGPFILGHAHKMVEEATIKAVIDSPSFGTSTRKEVEMAELITEMVPSIEKVRMVNSGSEATMSAIRLARGVTHRDKILKFEGCYHGHADSFLVAAGSGVLTTQAQNSPGVTQGVLKDTLLATFNDIENTKKIVSAFSKEIAAIIVEPVAGNMGCIAPDIHFLKTLRTLCDDNGIILIFDEVMTGFRLAKGGAQEIYQVYPDLTTLGKIIGGGLPVGAFGGKKELMNYISPEGAIYQAGTLSGNPTAMAAGLATLQILNETPTIYSDLQKTTNQIVVGLKKLIKKKKKKITINQVGSMFSLFFNSKEVTNYQQAKCCDNKQFSNFFHFMLNEGIYLPPSQYESIFISTEIRKQEIKKVLSAFESFLDK